MALSKIQAESMNLADTYAFSGTVSGTSDLVKVASSTTSQTGITAFTLDLPTTDDFSHLKCFIHGVGVSTAQDYWELQARDASGNSYRTGTSIGGDTNGDTKIQMADGFSGTYGDIGDLELEIDIFNNRGTGIANHSPRFNWRKQAQKRHTDEYTYQSSGSGVVIPFIEINQFKLFRGGGNTFTIYGYELYKVK